MNTCTGPAVRRRCAGPVWSTWPLLRSRRTITRWDINLFWKEVEKKCGHRCAFSHDFLRWSRFRWRNFDTRVSAREVVGDVTQRLLFVWCVLKVFLLPFRSAPWSLARYLFLTVSPWVSVDPRENHWNSCVCVVSCFLCEGYGFFFVLFRTETVKNFTSLVLRREIAGDVGSFRDGFFMGRAFRACTEHPCSVTGIPLTNIPNYKNRRKIRSRTILNLNKR